LLAVGGGGGGGSGTRRGLSSTKGDARQVPAPARLHRQPVQHHIHHPPYAYAAHTHTQTHGLAHIPIHTESTPLSPGTRRGKEKKAPLHVSAGLPLLHRRPSPPVSLPRGWESRCRCAVAQPTQGAKPFTEPTVPSPRKPVERNFHREKVFRCESKKKNEAGRLPATRAAAALVLAPGTVQLRRQRRFRTSPTGTGGASGHQHGPIWQLALCQMANGDTAAETSEPM